MQEIVAPLVAFEGTPSTAFGFTVGTKASGLFVSEGPLFALAKELELEPKALTLAGVRAALEVAYGAGKVQVSCEAPEAFTATVGCAKAQTPGETIAFRISTAFGSTPINSSIEGIGLEPEPEVKIVSPGTAPTPAVPDGEVVVTAENLGDAAANGESSPVELTDKLPPHLKAIGISGWHSSATAQKPEQLTCSSPSEVEQGKLRCSASGRIPPYGWLELRIQVDVEPGASSEEVNEAAIEGGGSKPASVSRHIRVGAETSFGLEQYALTNEEEGGTPSVQAGAHPFQQTTTIVLNQGPDPAPLDHKQETQPVGLARDTEFVWPAGLIGNPSAVPKCAIDQFYTRGLGPEENLCPATSVIGVAEVTVNEPNAIGTATFALPLFNLQPAPGEPARFGFNVLAGKSPVVIDTKVRSGGDYGVVVSSDKITQTAGFLSAKVTVWGTPGDPRHDQQRGWNCLEEGLEESHGPCVLLGENRPPPFLVLPTACSGVPLSSTLLADPWSAPGAFQEITEPMPVLVGCNQLPFNAEINVTPDGQAASTPTGLKVDVHVPQNVNENGAGLASSNVKDITVRFPQGVAVNPAAADGLQACSEGLVGFQGFKELEAGSLTATFTPEIEEPFCPDAAKVGTATIRTPLLPNPLEGALYLAKPAPNGETGNNPFNTLLAAYIVVKDPVSGVVVKVPGSVALDPVTGRLTATFAHNPQVAFEDAEIHLFGGDRAPLSTPSHCGTYTTEAQFTPWSGTPPITSSSSFQITSGPGGGPCPSSLPFGPSLAAGSTNVQAGAFSPLSTTISRPDGDQDIQTVSLHMPPGLSGMLKGVELCPEAQANAGTCGPGSLIGHTVVSVGLGGDPFSVTGGQVFLTEGYKGASFGLSIVNPAVAGPFDLGKVIVRAKVEVDPRTAALTVTTNTAGEGFSIPHILDGIPLQIKHVNVVIERAGGAPFVFNPTSCNPSTLTGTIGSDEGASAGVSRPFQVTNCAALKFQPKVSVSVPAHSSRPNGTAVSFTISYPKGAMGQDAWFNEAKFTLPKQLPARLTTIQQACLSATFEANPAACPAGSKIGSVLVHTQVLPVPLEGTAYFVSHGGAKFPDAVFIVHGYGITIKLVGETLIKNGITSATFRNTPDVPFEDITVTLPAGKYSEFGTNLPHEGFNFCRTHMAVGTFLKASNGLQIDQNTPVTVTGCPKANTRAQKLAAALKACRKKHGKQRASCERAARKAYGAKSSKRARRAITNRRARP